MPHSVSRRICQQAKACCGEIHGVEISVKPVVMSNYPSLSRPIVARVKTKELNISKLSFKHGNSYWNFCIDYWFIGFNLPKNLYEHISRERKRISQRKWKNQI